jgi:hypothetical protein
MVEYVLQYMSRSACCTGQPNAPGSRVHHRCRRPTARRFLFNLNAAAWLMRFEKVDMSFQVR